MSQQPECELEREDGILIQKNTDSDGWGKDQIWKLKFTDLHFRYKVTEEKRSRTAASLVD